MRQDVIEQFQVVNDLELFKIARIKLSVWSSSFFMSENDIFEGKLKWRNQQKLET